MSIYESLVSPPKETTTIFCTLVYQKNFFGRVTLIPWSSLWAEKNKNEELRSFADDVTSHTQHVNRLQPTHQNRGYACKIKPRKKRECVFYLKETTQRKGYGTRRGRRKRQGSKGKGLWCLFACMHFSALEKLVLFFSFFLFLRLYP